MGPVQPGFTPAGDPFLPALPASVGAPQLEEETFWKSVSSMRPGCV